MINSLHKKRCVAFATALVAAAMMLQGTGWALTSEERDVLIQIRTMLQQANADYERRKATYENVQRYNRQLKEDRITEAKIRAHFLQANILKNEGVLEGIDARLHDKTKEQVFSDQKIGDKKWGEAIKRLNQAIQLENTLGRSPREYPLSKWSANIGVVIGKPKTLKGWLQYWNMARGNIYYQASETSEGPGPESSPVDDTQVSRTSEGPEPESSPVDDTQGNASCKCEDPQSVDTKPDGSIKDYGREPNKFYRARSVVCEIKNGTDSTIVLDEVGVNRYYEYDLVRDEQGNVVLEQNKPVKRWQTYEVRWGVNRVEMGPQETLKAVQNSVKFPEPLGWKGLVEFERDGIHCKWNKRLVISASGTISWVGP